jgi:hypothetical protein
MKRSWDLKPNLLNCILEERIAPAIANLGVIALTTSGLTLVTPFPGAASLSVLGGGAAASSAPSVSGAAIPTSFYMTGRGISSFSPGNFTGNASVAGAITSSSGPGGTIQVGSGADDASAPVTPTASRNNQGSNGAAAPILAYIGSVSTGSGSTVPSATSTGTTQTAQTAPVPSLPRMGVVIPGSPTSMNGNPTNPMDPQSGAPRFMYGLTGKLVPTLPGGLGVQTSLSGTGSSGN